MEQFMLWQWMFRSPDAEPDENYYNGAVTFDVIGGKYLSTALMVSVFVEDPASGADVLEEWISTRVYDLTNGETEEDFGQLIMGGDAYTMGSAAEAFYEVYPETDNADAKAKFHDYMQTADMWYSYLLTKDTLAIFMPNDDFTGFNRFDAAYDAIPEMLAQPLVDALGSVG
jgi:hypothetical protein